MAVSGSQLTRIGGYLSGIGKKLTILAKAVGVLPDPASFAVQGQITAIGASVRLSLSQNGLSVQSNLVNSFAVQSVILSAGVSARSQIASSGQSVASKFKGL
jgi:hypothetical protein